MLELIEKLVETLEIQAKRMDVGGERMDLLQQQIDMLTQQVSDLNVLCGLLSQFIQSNSDEIREIKNFRIKAGRN